MTTLNDVYETVEKYLGIKKLDRNRIDVILATALSNKIPGTPIWLFISGSSGDWKSTFIRSLEGMSNVLLVDQLTKNTLASGKKNARDKGMVLQNSSHIILIPDLACVVSMNRDEKNSIFAQLRNLYDGFIKKDTGSGVEKLYTGCHVTIIACSTSVIKDEVLLQAQLGSRELLWNTDADKLDNKFKMKMALVNERYEKEMSMAFRQVVHNFYITHPIVDVEPSDEMKAFLMSEAIRLSMLRSSVPVDYISREPLSNVEIEVPTRIIKQFVRLYRCLKSLDPNYPDEKVKAIISHLVTSSGHTTRQYILDILNEEKEQWFRLSDIVMKLRVSRNSVYQQAEQLWNMGIIDKKTESEYGNYRETIFYKIKPKITQEKIQSETGRDGD